MINLSLEWETVELNDIVSLVIDYRGKTPKKLGSDWSEEGIRALSAKNIKTGKIIREDAIRFVDMELYLKWMKEEIKRNDILITSEAPFGEVYFWDSDEKIVLSQRLFAIRCDEKKVVPKFIYFYMTSEMFQWELTSRATGTTVKGLRQPELLKCNIQLPNYNTQLKIANMLSFLEDKINVLNKINHNLDALCHIIFKHYFIDFTPFIDKGFVDSEIGEIPKEWAVTTVGNILDCKLGGTPSRSNESYWDGDIAWINSGKINEFRIIEPSEYITEEGLKKSATKLLPAKTTVIAITGATLGQISLLEIDSCANQSVIGVIPNKEYPYEFVYPLISSILDDLLKHQTGGAQQHINKNNVESFNIVCPPKDIISKYTNIVSPLYSQISTNCFEIEKLQKLRDTLLPKLMSGEIDVSKINCDLD